MARAGRAIGSFSVPARPENLYAPVIYALEGGGKRMRPAAVFMGCAVYGDNLDDAAAPAVAVEVFHNFTLLHDDVMDDAPLRRGRPTVWKHYGLNTAILSGDVMLVRCYAELAKCHRDVLPQLLDIFNRTATEVCEGQQLDMDFEGRTDVTLEAYLHMINLKTAVLLGASLQMGALVGGATPDEASNLYQFGRLCGVAFQLQDDILDVYGDSAKVGKQVGGDILSNKKTYLLLKALEVADPDRRAELDYWTGPGHHDPAKKVQAVTHIYDELGIPTMARDMKERVYQGAREHLDRAGGRVLTRQQIAAYFDRLLHRDH